MKLGLTAQNKFVPRSYTILPPNSLCIGTTVSLLGTILKLMRTYVGSTCIKIVWCTGGALDFRLCFEMYFRLYDCDFDRSILIDRLSSSVSNFERVFTKE